MMGGNGEVIGWLEVLAKMLWMGGGGESKKVLEWS